MGRRRRRGRYERYMRSKAWKSRRREMLKAIPALCWVCRSTEHLCLHHKTYKRLKRELPEDFVWLCRKHHDGVHKLYQQQRKLRPRPSIWDATLLYRQLFREGVTEGVIERWVPSPEPEPEKVRLKRPEGFCEYSELNAAECAHCLEAVSV